MIGVARDKPIFDASLQRWPASREAALEQLKKFLPRSGRRYAETRNYDLGVQDRGNVSMLSPYLRSRLILEEDVLTAVMSVHSLSTAEKFVQEIFWRTYFKGWLEQRPDVWGHYIADLDSLHKELSDNSCLRKRYEQAINGRTGLECFDAWVEELSEVGYLHNHARMWFASIWIFTLGLPWQLGADFFLAHLVDGDPASNTLGWRWVAGLHTKGKNYIARAANIAKYTNGRFKPTYQLRSNPEPLSEDQAFERVPLPIPDELPPDENFGLLITEEDCSPESLALPQEPTSILGLVGSPMQGIAPRSQKILTFRHSAVSDAVKRAENLFGRPSDSQDTDEWSQVICAWAKRRNVNTLVTAYVPVSDTSSRLRCAQPALEAAGLRLIQIRRTYDSLSWPYATKGFFGLKSKIPRILAELSAQAA